MALRYVTFARTIPLLGCWMLAFASTCLSAEEVGFVWQEEEEDRIALHWNGRPALEYVMPTLDESSPQRRNATFKPFHHVYSPDGKTRLTKGPGGLYPHHRGMFYGFNRINHGDGKKCDTWHCTGKAYQRSVGISGIGETTDKTGKRILKNEASHDAQIHWHGQEGELFACERRVIAIRRTSHHDVEGWEIDFASQLNTTDGKPIHLDGDPQHAGFHFRASQEVPEKTAEQTYYVRTDGIGKPGDYRNWDPRQPRSPISTESVDRPWNALCFLLKGKRYTILYLDHSQNPKPARYSERDYGRFGSYFVAKVTQ